MSDRLSIKTRIRSRGHWRVAIHPKRAPSNRVDDLGELAALIPDHAVALRGWDFPHVDRRSPVARGLDWVGQESEWEHHLDSWRLYKSGLFLAMTAIPDDWRDQSSVWPADETWKTGTRLGVGDAVFSMTEFLELASRLAMSAVGDERMRITASLHGAKGRFLHVDSRTRAGFVQPHESHVDEIPFEWQVERTMLVSAAWDLAVQQAYKLFQVFGWDAQPGVLEDHQRELRGFRSG